MNNSIRLMKIMVIIVEILVISIVVTIMNNSSNIRSRARLRELLGVEGRELDEQLHVVVVVVVIH